MKEKTLLLIKSLGEVKGPYTLEKIIEDLRDKKISINDDICMPEKIWWPIYEIEEFKEIVAEARRSSLKSSSGTKTESLDSETSSKTEALSQTFTDNLTEKLEISNEDEILIEDIVEESSYKEPREKEKVKSYGFEGSQKAKSEAKKIKKKSTKVAIGFVLVIFLYVVLTKLVIEPQQTKEGFRNLTVLGIDHFKLGLYEDAYEYFHKANEYGFQNDDLNFYYGTLLAQLKNKEQEGNLRLGQIDSPEAFLIRLKNMYGNINYSEKKYEEARNYYLDAKKVNPLFAPTEVNLASVALSKNQLNMAIKHLVSSLEMQVEDAYSVLLLSHAYFLKSAINQDNSLLIKSNELLNELIFSKKEYYAEAIVLKAYYGLKNGEAISEKSIQKLFLVPIDYSEKFVGNIFINKRILSWKNINNYCQEVAEKISMIKYKNLLKGYCLTKSGNMSAAKKIIRKATLMKSSDSEVQAFESYIMFKSGLRVDSDVSLSRAIKHNKKEYFLPNYLQASSCEKNKDFKCSKESWLKIYKKYGNSLWSYSGLANSYFYLGRKKSAQENIKNGFSISNKYKPLLKLNYEINKNN